LRVSAEGFGTILVILVQARTGRPAVTGFLLSAVLMPYVVSGPVLGRVLDQALRPRRVAVLLAFGYVVAIAALLAAAGRVPLPLAVVAAVAVGCTEPIVVALSGLLPRIVPGSRLSRAYGLESASYNLAGIAGPGLAAAIAAWSGPSVGAEVIVGIAILGMLAMPLLRVPPPPGAEPMVARLDMLTGGLRVLLGNRVLRALTAGTTLGFLGMGGVSVVAILLAEELHKRPSAGGGLLVAFAVGALAGSLCAARWLSARNAEWVVLGGMTGFGCALAVAPAGATLPWAVLWFGLAGACDGPVLAATLMLRQREAPPGRLGQVNTTGGSLKIGAAAVGAALTGVLAGWAGAPGLMLAMAGLQFAGAGLTAALLRRGS
jgi:MFS family permease